MPIDSYDLDAGTLNQVCASCGANRQVALNTLVLGAAPAPGVVAPDVVLLPACPCGAVEVLLRTWDTMPAAERGSVTDKQRRAVNAIAQALKAAGRSQPDAKAQHDAETTAPPDVGDRAATALRVRNVVAGKPADGEPASNGFTPEYEVIKQREDAAEQPPPAAE